MGQLPAFDQLKEFAERDPEGFEALRESYCEAFIASIPPANRGRLRAVQFRVNRVIHAAPNPLAGLIQVSGMMHDSLAHLRWQIQDLAAGPSPGAEPARARIIHLDDWRRGRARDAKN